MQKKTLGDRKKMVFVPRVPENSSIEDMVVEASPKAAEPGEGRKKGRACNGPRAGAARGAGKRERKGTEPINPSFIAFKEEGGGGRMRRLDEPQREITEDDFWEECQPQRLSAPLCDGDFSGACRDRVPLSYFDVETENLVQLPTLDVAADPSLRESKFIRGVLKVYPSGEAVLELRASLSAQRGTGEGGDAGTRTALRLSILPKAPHYEVATRVEKDTSCPTLSEVCEIKSRLLATLDL